MKWPISLVSYTVILAYYFPFPNSFGVSKSGNNESNNKSTPSMPSDLNLLDNIYQVLYASYRDRIEKKYTVVRYAD